MKTPNTFKQDKMKSHIPFRLNLLFFIVFLLFVILILRLGYMQIIQGEEYQAEVERTESTIITNTVARGEIFDANLQKLVGNEARNAITYTRGQNTSAETMAQVAYNLASIISMPNASPFDGSDSTDISERDMKDYFYAANRDVVKGRTDQYLEGNEDIDPNAITYQDSLDFITEEDLRSFTEQDKTATAIFTKMNSAYALSTVNVKNEEVSNEEIAAVGENLDALPGVGTGTDWVRTYPEGNMLRSILGNVSDEDRGLPESELNAYLAKGYSRNDRVGLSFLEKQYEDVLKGTKSRIETETNNNGDIVNQVLQHHGSKGDNLILATDIEFQKTVENIARDSLTRRRGLNDSIYIVAMDPRDGDILALTGQKVNENGEVVDDAQGVISQSFAMGSSVKGATVLAGYMDGVITEDDNVIVDQPLKFSGSPSITSVFNRTGRRPVNDIQALQYSSNIYMSTLAMRMGGKTGYEYNEPLIMNGELAMHKLRYYFEQFGLGVPTGIDLPSEATGQEGILTSSVQTLFQSFGQFDTYTALQLAQYISTIANNGTRIAPRFVSEIRGTNPETGGVGELKTEIPPKIMNHVTADPGAMDRVQEGLYEVLNGGYGFGSSHFGDAPYEAAGKTGTAETPYWSEDEELRGTPVINMTFAAYAPYNNPEIAVATVVPYLPDNLSNQENIAAARRVMDAYFQVGTYAQENPEEAEDANIEELESSTGESTENESEDTEETDTEEIEDSQTAEDEAA